MLNSIWETISKVLNCWWILVQGQWQPIAHFATKDVERNNNFLFKIARPSKILHAQQWMI